ncbi:hypothetical protein [Amycolatopsis sp.]|uniref:hypothetical protein n=1 Tax=Amycolatopsis sp. TaxID=37632 RepID=UPI002BC0C562|nr:hypothetical protein [Amycolatopsis sp.]HVV08713.1 hypothetical protein [Amycolatopsis sp.]
MTQPDLDSWKPPALREAEAQLDETMVKARDLIKKTEEKLKQLPDIDNTAKPEDIARIKAAAERPDAPAEMRALKKKVDAGELTWKDVLEGKALKDPAVREAMRARLGEMREIYQEAEEGATLEEILEARGVTGSVFNGGGATRPQAAPQPVQQSEDDYFAGNNFLAGRQAPPPPPPPQAPPPQPPVPPARPPQPHRPAPRVRPPQEPPADDFFEDPLAPRNKPTAPPQQPKPQPRRRPRDDDGDDDDYFGGPVMR